MWLSRDESQRVLWPSTLRLSLDYFENLTKFAVPLDERAISTLAHSALALDIYGWMAQRLHRVPASKPPFITWVALHEQFGQEYARIRKFREIFLGMLKQVHAAYPNAKFEVDGGGMTLFIPRLRPQAVGHSRRLRQSLVIFGAPYPLPVLPSNPLLVTFGAGCLARFSTASDPQLLEERGNLNYRIVPQMTRPAQAKSRP